VTATNGAVAGLADSPAARRCYPDGRAFVGVGVQPQVAAAPRVGDFLAGRDTVPEIATALLRQ
jgi:hypothetical protein